MRLKVVLHHAEDGGYWAEIPALPGCVSEGETLDETIQHIRETAAGWLHDANGNGHLEVQDPYADIEEIEL